MLPKWVNKVARRFQVGVPCGCGRVCGFGIGAGFGFLGERVNGAQVCQQGGTPLPGGCALNLWVDVGGCVGSELREQGVDGRECECLCLCLSCPQNITLC